MIQSDKVGRRGPLIGAGLALGIGLGGMMDGIVLHELLQWHNMLSSVLPPHHDMAAMKVNMFWDGMFHALTWAISVLGVLLMWRASRRADTAWSPRALIGGAVAGWGLFNLVEGLVDHQILGLHHVKPGPTQLAWDLGYLASGVLLLVIGAAVARDKAHAQHAATPRARPATASP